MNDGDVYGTTLTAGTVSVAEVETVTPDERRYKVVVSMMTVYELDGMLTIDDGIGYCAIVVGTDDNVYVDGKIVTGDEIDENGTDDGMFDQEITTWLGCDERTVYQDCGSDETAEAGTIYGDEKLW
jgi:hypothetical protein